MMMYGYMTLSDGTGVAHSDVKDDGSVKVYFERPVDGGFLDATCFLPSYRWESNHGFADSDMKYFDNFLKNNAHLILTFAREGGFENASSF